jgi:hypothetical protein
MYVRLAQFCVIYLVHFVPDWANSNRLGDCYFRHFFENYRSSPNCRAIFATVKVMY